MSDSVHSGLVDGTEDVEASDHTSILGSGTLRVVDIGRDVDDGLDDGGSEVGLRDLLHILEDYGRDLLRRLEVKDEMGKIHRTHMRIKGTYEGLGLAVVLSLRIRLPDVRGDLEREVLHVGLDLCVVELATNEAFRVKRWG